VRDSIKPDLTMFIEYKTMQIEDKNIIKLGINVGNKKPYYIYNKGLKSSGVYIRQGISAVPASEDNIKKMIKESDGDSFERMRAINQDLTFKELTNEFTIRKTPLTDVQMTNLGIVSQNDKLYTNLGLLLSDQANHTIKAAVFQGTDKSIFRDRKEFSGSILSQLEESYEYIMRYNNLRAEIMGLYRLDRYDYPEMAIREALLNSIIHREYSYSGSILISIFDDRIEIVTIGGLVSGIELEDIFMGVSQSRNERLAAIFHRLNLVEAYGTGISKIMKSYENKGIKPLFEVSNNAFKVTLFNMNYEFNSNDFSDSEQLIIKLFNSKNSITRLDAEEVLNVSQTMAGRILKQLVEKGIIQKRGLGPKTHYIKSR
ncbi:MAG: AAA family ATPase, partial [Clostridiales bacterium]|nr:AAA family ATPase [Clostridiales bacterium]